MKKISYKEMISEAFRLYYKEEYEEGYNLFTENQDVKDGCLTAILYIRSALACLMNEKELGLEILRESIMDYGFWYPRKGLEAEKDFDSIREEPAFMELLYICDEREKKHMKKSSPKLELVDPKSGFEESSKILVYIHGNDPYNASQKELRDFLDMFEEKVYYDYTICYPISSYINFTGVPIWNDIKKGAKEIQKHCKKIENYYKYNLEDMTLICTSAGGMIALEVIAQRLINFKKVVFIVPYLPNIKELKDKLSVFKELDISVYTICGDQDKPFFDQSKEFVKHLDDLGVRNKFKILKGSGHDFRDDYDEILLEAKHYLDS